MATKATKRQKKIISPPPFFPAEAQKKKEARLFFRGCCDVTSHPSRSAFFCERRGARGFFFILSSRLRSYGEKKKANTFTPNPGSRCRCRWLDAQWKHWNEVWGEGTMRGEEERGKQCSFTLTHTHTHNGNRRSWRKSQPDDARRNAVD